MIEKNCVSRFVNKTQTEFAQGSTLQDVFEHVPQYREFIKRAYGSMPNNFVHNLGTSTMGLKTLAIYEFLRHKRIPLPDSNNVIHKVMPIKNCAALVLFKAGIVDIRDEDSSVAKTQDAK